MPRSFSDDTNELIIFDNISNSQIVLNYRMPTTRERTAYANESVSRQRNKIVTKVPETRIKFGEIILTGFREGDFTIKKNGKTVPLSSDPSSPNYYSEWKTMIREKAADLLMYLASQVFDGSAETEDAGFEPDEEVLTESAEKN